MPRAKNGEVALEYEIFGSGGEAVLLINGLGSQMTRWPEAFCKALAERGYKVIRFDNRDVGLSTWPEDAYSLKDMARDGVAVLDAAGVARAHLAGVSMGGMIAQRIALDHPGRALSLTSIMSSTGAAGAMRSTPEASRVLTVPPPDPAADYEGYIGHMVRNMRVIGSPAYPWTDAEARARAVAEHARAYNPAAAARQMAAIRADGDRTEALRALGLPTVVLHGADDPLILPDGGRATAAAISGAELRIIAGMGHDLPPGLHQTFIEAIEGAASRTPGRSAL